VEERLGLLFSDGSILVLPEGTSAETAKREAEEHDAGDPNAPTRVVRIVMDIVEIIADKP
jgi:hypothetical protein